MERTDLNCDMGEGMGSDSALMRCISSANIACGYHAGSEALMEQTVGMALRFGVAIGAHPGFEDRANFGRTEMHLSEEEVYALVRRQIQLLRAICSRLGAMLHHVKPHGALYNMAARDRDLAACLVRAVADEDPGLILYGLSGSHLVSVAGEAGLPTAAEVFADRTYQDDGSLTSRTMPGAMITEEDSALAQVLRMVKEGRVVSVSGTLVPIAAETICIHGDGAHAVPFAHRIRSLLLHEGIEIKAP
jgi:5-oxoprolinase (ATP-hydrolysing) subunit A